MKKLLTLATLALTLSACEGPNNVSGTLTLKKEVLFVGSDGNKAVLTAGRFPAAVATDQNGSTVSIQTAAGQMNFHVPPLRLDSEGRFSVPGGELGQTFDLHGQIVDQRHPFDRVASKGCIHHHEMNFECFNPGPHDCNWAQRPVYGEQDVRQQGYQQIKRLQIDLVRVKTLGTFLGEYKYDEVITDTDLLGSCRMLHY